MIGVSTLNILIEVVTVLIKGSGVTSIKLIQIHELCLHFVIGGVSGLETKDEYSDLIAH